MRLLQGTNHFQIEENSAVVIGKFDGLHSGHQALLETVLACRQEGLQTVVLVFDLSEAPFRNMELKKELTTREEKRQIIEEMGIDVLIEFPLNELTSRMPAEEFVTDILLRKLKMKKVIAGSDVSFGYGGAGNAVLLETMAEKFAYEAVIIPKICYERKEISSSYVREEIERGNMQFAEKLLGHPYSITGLVSYGNQIGRTMGLPTVNLVPPPEKLLPPNGVYFAKVLYEGQELSGITNIGSKPTVNKEPFLTVETYIFDFEREIYGQMITVQLLAFRRPEIKFGNLEDLKAQILRDKEAGTRFFM